MATKKAREYKADNLVWYIFYIIVNVFTLGSAWFLRNLISYAIENSK
ncbi:MAG TPA: hypothetical protein PLK34_01675 [Candidatus Pacearchaeota archaeon]|nr:hypothetical protein [Candidatus Pacearchaeota archaeon]